MADPPSRSTSPSSISPRIVCCRQRGDVYCTRLVPVERAQRPCYGGRRNNVGSEPTYQSGPRFCDIVLAKLGVSVIGTYHEAGEAWERWSVRDNVAIGNKKARRIGGLGKGEETRMTEKRPLATLLDANQGLGRVREKKEDGIHPSRS